MQEEDKSIQKIIAKLEELRESGELPGIEDENEEGEQDDKTRNQRLTDC